MAAHQPCGDLEILLFGGLARPDDPPDSHRIGSKTLLHEDVHPLLHRVLQVSRPEAGMGRQQGHVARLQAVDRLAVGVEAQELPVGGNVDGRGEFPAKVPVRDLEPWLEDVGHGDQLGVAVGDRQGVGHRPGSAASAADQRQADRVVLGGVDAWNRHTGQGGARGQFPAPFHEIPPRQLARLRLRRLFPLHGLCSLVNGLSLSR